MSRRKRGVVHAKDRDRIEFTIYVGGKRFRPTLPLAPTEANLRRAQPRIQGMYARIDAGTFDLLEEFPDYRLKRRYSGQPPAPLRLWTCNEIFDRFLTYSATRVAMSDLAFSTLTEYRRTLDRAWRPRLGTRRISEVIFSELLEIAVSQKWRTKRTYNSGLTHALERLPIRYREPYNARHSFVTWNLMIGRNPLWVADQNGHAPEVMLTTYAQWQRGATEDIKQIRHSMGTDSTGAALTCSIRDGRRTRQRRPYGCHGAA